MLFKLLIVAMAPLCLNSTSEAAKLAPFKRLVAAPGDSLALKRVFKIHSMSLSNSWFGTGSLINTKDGVRIITNRHVCQDAVQITAITASDKIERTLQLVRINKDRADLCLLKPDETLDTSSGGYDVANELQQLPQPVTIYGYPLAGEIVSGKSAITAIFRMVDTDPHFNGVQAEALEEAVVPGSSGSPILNEKGEMVGVVFALDNRRGQEHVTGLGVPLKAIKQFLFNGGK